MVFSYDDLVAKGRDMWDGVRNAGALAHMRRMRQGDLAFFCHTGQERRAVAICRLVSDHTPNRGRATRASSWSTSNRCNA